MLTRYFSIELGGKGEFSDSQIGTFFSSRLFLLTKHDEVLI